MGKGGSNGKKDNQTTVVRVAKGGACRKGGGGLPKGVFSPAFVFLPLHYGTKPGDFETSKIHFPTSKGVSEVSERANE